jgi:ABC-type dipeptide/oligopeptide/nickel transport system permease subunit
MSKTFDNDDLTLISPAETPQRKKSGFRRIVRVYFSHPLPTIGFIFIAVMAVTAIFAPWLAPYDPIKNDLTTTLSGPTAQHWLGTDQLGRDTLSRIIYGARVSMTVALSVVIIANAIGITLGLIAAYYGGIPFAIIMRAMDVLMAFPQMILYLMIAALLGGGIINVILALTIGMIAGGARLTCGLALSVRQNDYVLAGRAIGAANFRIMFQHVLPNCLSLILVMGMMELGGVILAEAGMSFLGIGIAQPTPSWGSMVNEGRRWLLSNPLLSFAPGIAITMIVFGFNMMADGLRDALDPRLRGAL